MSTTVQKPSKQQLREYLYARHKSPEPPPAPERVREMLGWKLSQRER